MRKERYTIARGDVVDDRTCVSNRPCVPYKFYGVSRVDVGIKAASRGTLVAVDICCSGIRRFNKANVLIESIPACSFGAVIFGGIEP